VFIAAPPTVGISATGYDRTYEATMSLENLNSKTTPGRALRI